MNRACSAAALGALTLIGAAFLACGEDREATITVATSTPPAVVVSATASAKAGTSGTPAASSTPAGPAPTPAAGAAQLAAMHGYNCVGQWRNTTLGTSGAFAARLNAGGSGGEWVVDLGGLPFGQAGGTISLPFLLNGTTMEIQAQTPLLGRVSARVNLDGTGTAELSAIPALGTRSVVKVTQFSMLPDRLRVEATVDPGDGKPVQQSGVDAACRRG